MKLPPRDTNQSGATAGEWGWAAGGAVIWTFLLAVVRPTAFGGLDFPRICEPYIRFFRTSLLNGELPWWNPYASLGRPYLADLQTASFYPATFLSVIFGVWGGWMVATAAHAMLAIFGFTRLMNWLGVTRAAAWVGGIVFLFSAPLFARMQAGQVNYVYSLCYLPLVLWLAGRYAAERTSRSWAALAFVWGMQLLCCHPQVFWLSIFGAGLFVTGWLMQAPWGSAWRNWLWSALGMIAACACGMALIGFVLVPFTELIGESNRAAPSLAFSSAFAMNPSHWLSLLSPASHAFASNWEYDTYFGLVALLGGTVALLRWKDAATRGVALMVAVSLIVMAGENTALFPVLYRVVPGLSSFRVPARAGALVVLGVTMGAAMLAGAPVSRRRSRMLLASASVAAAIGVGVFFLRVMPNGKEAASWFLGRMAHVAVVMLAWWLWLGRSPADHAWMARIRAAMLPAMIVADFALAIWGQKQLPQYPTDFPAETLVVKAIQAKGLDRQIAPVRVLLPPPILRANSGMIYGYATPVGFESLTLGRVWNYLHRAVGADPNHAYNTSPSGKVFEGAAGLNSLNLTVSLPADSALLAVNPRPDPRAYVTNQTVIAADRDDAIARMISGHDFHEVAVVERAFPVQLSPAREPGQSAAEIRHFRLTSLDLEVESAGEGLLVVAEAWYPGWHATVNGRDMPCIPVNGWMRGVAVPSGHSVVKLYYRQNGLISGALLSVAAAGVLGWAWWRPRHRQSAAAV